MPIRIRRGSSVPSSCWNGDFVRAPSAGKPAGTFNCLRFHPSCPRCFRRATLSIHHSPAHKEAPDDRVPTVGMPPPESRATPRGVGYLLRSQRPVRGWTMDVRRVVQRSALAILVLWSAMAGLGAEVHVLSDQPLSGTATRALDVRWLDENAVLVTVYDVGVVQVDTRNISNLRTIVHPATPPCRYCGDMALSSDYLATATPVAGIAWRPRGQTQSHSADLPPGAVRDIDVYKNRVAILGSWLED